ncbi:MAG: 50S ribosomal protein L9 [Alphaproteobacteria bacterium]|nr:50S ribosomal protein L9 [Alphaproteobacteria bacterium]
MAQRQVILLEKLHSLGEIGETVSVKPGFARNFLIPQGKALPATKSNVAKFESMKAELEKANKEKAAAAQAVADKLDGVKVVLGRQASEVGMLYGTIRPRDITESVKEMTGVELDKSIVTFKTPIKEVGEHLVTITLHSDVIVELPLEVGRVSA